MKKLFYTLLLSVIVINANALGNVLPWSLNFGVKTGLNMYDVSGINIKDGFKGSFVGGLYLGIHNHNTSITVEGLFNQQTVQAGNNFDDVYHQYISQSASNIVGGKFKFNNISIPVLFGYKPFALLPLWFQIGPQFTNSFSIKDKDQILNNVKQVFKKGSVAGVVGAQVNLPFHLNVAGRFIFDFSNINKTNISESWKSKTIQLTVGYGF